MKTSKILPILLLLSLQKATAQDPINWTSDQLMEPSELAAALKSAKDFPVILSVGPGALIPHSKGIGMVKEEESMKKFREELAGLSKDSRIVIYCGCCPFEHCPNVRPAVDVLRDLKFTNFRLLNLPHNIKVDWINKGYPVN